MSRDTTQITSKQTILKNNNNNNNHNAFDRIFPTQTHTNRDRQTLSNTNISFIVSKKKNNNKQATIIIHFMTFFFRIIPFGGRMIPIGTPRRLSNY